MGVFVHMLNKAASMTRRVRIAESLSQESLPGTLSSWRLILSNHVPICTGNHAKPELGTFQVCMCKQGPLFVACSS